MAALARLGLGSGGPGNTGFYGRRLLARQGQGRHQCDKQQHARNFKREKMVGKQLAAQGFGVRYLAQGLKGPLALAAGHKPRHAPQHATAQGCGQGIAHNGFGRKGWQAQLLLQVHQKEHKEVHDQNGPGVDDNLYGS